MKRMDDGWDETPEETQRRLWREKARRAYPAQAAHRRQKARERYAEQTAVAAALGVSGYEAAHAKIERRRGRANEYVCAAAGCVNDAQDWALKPDAKALVQPEGQQGWSMSVWEYLPLCRQHHRALDRGYGGEVVHWREVFAA